MLLPNFETLKLCNLETWVLHTFAPEQPFLTLS